MTTNEVDLEALRGQLTAVLSRAEAEAKFDTFTSEGFISTQQRAITKVLGPLSEIFAELTARRARDAEPSAEYWLTAIVELYGSEAEDLTILEQRARELSEGK